MMHPHLAQLAAAEHRNDMLRRAARRRLKIGDRPLRASWWRRLITGQTEGPMAQPVVDFTALKASAASVGEGDQELIPVWPEGVCTRIVASGL